jgi:hypothetical protein
MKSDEEIMEILEAFDLTQSYRDAGELAGCDHHTVAHWIDRRDRGELSSALVTRDRLIGAFTDKLEEWVDQSNGKVRADICHDKLTALGYVGSDRTTRRAVAAASSNSSGILRTAPASSRGLGANASMPPLFHALIHRSMVLRA